MTLSRIEPCSGSKFPYKIIDLINTLLFFWPLTVFILSLSSQLHNHLTLRLAHQIPTNHCNPDHWIRSRVPIPIFSHPSIALSIYLHSPICRLRSRFSCPICIPLSRQHRLLIYRCLFRALYHPQTDHCICHRLA